MRGLLVSWMVVLACLGAGCGQEVQPPPRPEHEKPVAAKDKAGLFLGHVVASADAESKSHK